MKYITRHRLYKKESEMRFLSSQRCIVAKGFHSIVTVVFIFHDISEYIMQTYAVYLIYQVIHFNFNNTSMYQ